MSETVSRIGRAYDYGSIASMNDGTLAQLMTNRAGIRCVSMGRSLNPDVQYQRETTMQNEKARNCDQERNSVSPNHW
jgi:hypothetical protein